MLSVIRQICVYIYHQAVPWFGLNKFPWRIFSSTQSTNFILAQFLPLHFLQKFYSSRIMVFQNPYITELQAVLNALN